MLGTRLIRELDGRKGRLAIALLSLPMFALVYYAAYWIRFDGRIPPTHMDHFVHTLPWVLLAKVMIFGLLRVYSGWSRFVTFYDLVTLAEACVASAFVLVLAAYFFLPHHFLPRSILLLDCGLTLSTFGFLRSIGRLRRELPWRPLGTQTARRTFILGANDAGETLLRAIRQDPRQQYRVVGFIRTTLDPVPAQIAGVPVVAELDDLERWIHSHRVGVVLIAGDHVGGAKVRRILETAKQANVEVKIVPSIEQLLGNRFDLRPRTVSIEDLLRREPVQLNMRRLHRWIDGRVLMVTGASGSIGSEICRQLLQFNPRRLILVDRNENGQFYLQRELTEIGCSTEIVSYVADAGDRQRMRQILDHDRPDVLFHAAAYKHVPLMECNPGEAVKNIVGATRTLADLAEQHGVGKFVMISTDKAVNPTSVMGACKRVAEVYVQSLARTSRCQFVTVRFGNVLDSAGSVVPIFRSQIEHGGPVTVTHPDMKRYFMTIPEASQLVLQAGTMGKGGEIFVLDMGQPVRILHLAKEMVALSGLQVGRDIEIKITGLRPGEKLFEELHHAGEQHLPTTHPKILVASSEENRREAMLPLIAELEKTAADRPERVVPTLGRLVPQYRPEPIAGEMTLENDSLSWAA